MGRHDELEQLLALMTDGGSAVVVGEAGVGKSRLIAEVAARLRQRGRLVVPAACLPLASPLPLLPIVDVLKTLFRGEVGRVGRAVLESCPAYVRDELARVLPDVGQAPATPATWSQDWQQERLFSALMDFCEGVSASQPWTVVVDDLHWSDSITRDFLTYLLARRPPGLSVLLTARSADPRADRGAVDWLRDVHSAVGLTALDLGPLSRSGVRELAALVRGSPVPEQTVADLFRRAEGNAFFTEQLLAAHFESAAGLPEGLAQLLRDRVADLRPVARRLVEALAVAARTLAEPELARVTGQPPTEGRRALRDLLRRQLVRTDDDAGFTIKHALLGEAVAESLLPGERAELSGSIAAVLLARGDPALAGEAADHLARADRPGEELLARVDAAEYAETIGAFATAAPEWERATELAESVDRARVGGLALRTMVAWDYGGATFRGEQWGHRGLAAARAHGQQQIEASVLTKLAMMHHVLDRETGRSEYRQAIDLFAGLPPSAEEVHALNLLYRSYALTGRRSEGLPYLERAVAIGNDPRFGKELVPALISLSSEYSNAGDLVRGLAAYERARDVVQSLDDPYANAWMAIAETEGRLRLNLLEEAARVGERELVRLRTLGIGDAFMTAGVLLSTVQALLELGRVGDAERLVDRAIQDSRVPSRHWPLDEARSRLDLVAARLDASASGVARILGLEDQRGTEYDCSFAEHRAELALWQGRPETALEVVHSVLGRLRGTGDEALAARLLVLGMRACADLRGARGPRVAVREDETARQELAGAVEQLAVDPFADHAYYVTAVAEGVEWRAETERADGRDRPGSWEAVGVGWDRDRLARPHRAAYARWRQSEALLRDGERESAAAWARVAWRQADEHVPLRTALSNLARMARIDLGEPSAPITAAAERPTPFGLTRRELDVLRLLVDGRTNAEIGARLYMSTKTASVHVSAILRKLEATNRVHAATIAQRTGVLGS